MADRPGDEPLRRLTEDLRRVGIEALLSLQERLRRYVGMAGATRRDATRRDEPNLILQIYKLLRTVAC